MGSQRRNSKTIPKVGIVGCGTIGSLLDEGDPSLGVLSHAAAYQRCQRLELKALSDNDWKRLSECGNKRKVTSLYTDYKEMFENEEIDILSICTPTDHRLDIFSAALESGIKVILCEKPIARTIEEGKRIQGVVEKHNALVTVNYTRRWDTSIKKAQKFIQTGRLGKIENALVRYTKGILNNGSHLIDLMNLFFGLPSYIKSIRAIDDNYHPQDPTLDGIIEYKQETNQFPVYFLSSDWRHYSIIEIDIIGTEGRMRLVDGGKKIEVYSITKESFSPGYSVLSISDEISDLNQFPLLAAVEEVADLYHGKAIKSSCTFNEGLNALLIAESLKDSLKSGSGIQFLKDQETETKNYE